MNARLARFIHSSLLRLATPALLARWWWHNRGAKGGSSRLGERLALGVPDAEPGALWLHADTAVQARAAITLLAALRPSDPGLRVLFTHRSAGAREAAQAALTARDQVVWLPVDTPGAARRFLRRHRPEMGVLVQHVVGPNLVEQARRGGVPLLLVDARLETPQGGYRGVPAALHREVLAGLDTVLAQTPADALHLREAGAPFVKVSGGLAYDQTPPARRLARGLQWRQALARPVILAAGMHEGEEAMLLRAWLALPAPRPLLLMVPQQARRFNAVAARVREGGWSLLRRSSFNEALPAEAAQVDVWLGDTRGEMPSYYGAADVCLLGGSFTAGGRNADLVEACACGCPAVIGPFTADSERAVKLALGAGAARRADDLAEAVALAVAMADDGNRNEWVQRAFAFARAHRGAPGRMASEILRMRDARGQR